MKSVLRLSLCVCAILIGVGPVAAQTVLPFQAGLYSRQIVFDADRSRAYIVSPGSGGSGGVWVIDTVTRQLLAAIPLSGQPTDAVLDAANNRLYVANWGGHRIDVIDGASFTQTGSFAIGNGTYPYFAYPTDLALDAVRQRLYVTHDVPAGNISVVDLRSRSLLGHVVTNGGSTVGIAFDPAANAAYAVAYSRTLYAVSGDTLELDWSLADVGAGNVELDVRTGDLFVGSNNFVEGTHHVTRVDRALRKIRARRLLPDVTDVEVGGRRGRVYASDYWNNRIYVLDPGLGTDALLGSFAFGYHMTAVAADPGTGLLWATDELGHIYIMDDQFGNAAPVARSTQLTTAEDTPLPLVLDADDPDGDTLIFSLVDQPSHGVLHGVWPNLTYFPAPNYVGSDSFTFRVNDGQENSAVATISIAVTAVNDPPIVSAAGPYSTTLGEPVVLAALGYDVEDASLAYAWDLDGDGTFETAGQNVTFTPAGAGTWTVQVRALDSGGLSAVASARIRASYDVCLLYNPERAVRSGATIPLKVQLCDAAGANLSSPSVALVASGLIRISDLTTDAVEDAGQANPDDNFRYDSSLRGYVFNLQTAGLTTGTWRLTLSATGDPETKFITFNVR